MTEEKSGGQNVFLYDRRRLEMTGITDVSAFSDQTVEMTCNDGCIAVDGSDLKIESFSAETGRICITGLVSGFCYFGKAVSSKGKLWRRGRS